MPDELGLTTLEHIEAAARVRAERAEKERKYWAAHWLRKLREAQGARIPALRYFSRDQARALAACAKDARICPFGCDQDGSPDCNHHVQNLRDCPVLCAQNKRRTDE